ncbi:MAG TPA: alkaline phosphatase family protein [Planctomycetota bacterium]|nr:alkaline phosphatase family protein [Planctomycetota bacterium]
MRMQRCLAALVALAVACPVAHALDIEKPRNIILIGWDGAQRQHVHEALDRGELPTLKALAAEGVMLDVDVKGTTDTKAGWSQILTGYNPDVTGVYSNGRYRDVPKGLSLFERLEEHFGKDDFVTVAVIGKKGHCGEIDPPKKTKLEAGKDAEPPVKEKAKGKRKGRQPGAGKAAQGQIVEEDGVKYRVFGGSPYYTMHFACDTWEFGLMQDAKVGTRALALLEQHKDKPFFFFVHFAEVDHSGHKHGENSKEYNDALISNDTWTGKILEKLKELKLDDKTLVYVTADHGFNEGAKNHSKAPFIFLATNDKRVQKPATPTTRADVPATILARFGFDLAKLQPPLAGRPLVAR